jgi:hypothetical protein
MLGTYRAALCATRRSAPTLYAVRDSHTTILARELCSCLFDHFIPKSFLDAQGYLFALDQ